MIELIFLKTHNRYTSLPLLGTLVDDFAVWLIQHGYRRETIRVMLLRINQLDPWLRRRDIENVTKLDSEILEAAWKHFYRRGGARSSLGAAIRALARYLGDRAFYDPGFGHRSRRANSYSQSIEII